MWASPCWKRRTRVNPVSAPDSSLQCKTPKSAKRIGRSRYDLIRAPNMRQWPGQFMVSSPTPALLRQSKTWHPCSAWRSQLVPEIQLVYVGRDNFVISTLVVVWTDEGDQPMVPKRKGGDESDRWRTDWYSCWRLPLVDDAVRVTTPTAEDDANKNV